MEKEKIEFIDTEKLKVYDKNNKKHPQKQVSAIAESIRRLGFINPILIDKDNLILAGHGRLKAVQYLREIHGVSLKTDNGEEVNLDTVKCMRITNLTDNQLKAYRIWDNKSSELGSWDFESMKIDFDELVLEGLDDLTGFKDTDFNFLDMSSKDQEEEDEFIVSEHIRKSKSKLEIKEGYVFKLGEHRLMCGSSTCEEDVIKLMGDNKPVLMVTDPPYGVNYNPQWRNEVDKSTGKIGLAPARALGKVKNDHLVDWSDAYNLFQGNVAYVWHAGVYSPEVAKNLIDCGYKIISQIIWAKPHFAMSRGDYHWQHEPCWYVVKDGENHNWQGSRKEKTVWEIAGMNAMGSSQNEDDERTDHSTQKPIECMARPIQNNTVEGECVYDPFGGSGTTLIAAERKNRKCLMMELDPDYIKLIIDRWEKATGKRAERIE